jgi:uncharacterized delta-60 repeat protein
MRNGSNNDFAVIRFTPAGGFDTTFGGTGIVTFDFFSTDDGALAVAVDSLDRVVVAGYAYTGPTPDFAVARLTAAGALDSSFDGDGKQTIDFGEVRDEAYGVAIDSLDRVVLAGSAFIGSNDDIAVARLTAAGVLDASFDGDGKQTITFGTSGEAANGVTIDSLNRVVLGGYAGGDFAIVRLTSGGSLDTSFDGDGKQVVDFGATDQGRAVAVDSLNRVVVAGYAFAGPVFHTAVARLTTAGTPDVDFSGDGKQFITFGSQASQAYGVGVDSLDRIVLAGFAFSFFAVTRLTIAGELDLTFNDDGKQTIDFATGPDAAQGVAIDSADRVVVAGYTTAANIDFALARLTGDTTTAVAQVNDGAAQRSRVTSLTVRFSGVVTFSGAPAQAFTLMRNGGKAVSFTANVSVEFGGTVVTLTNFTGAETQFGSLRDGRYTLTALASQITADGQPLDGDADGTPGGNFVFGDAQGLYRFFGDVNGDRNVDIADFGQFSATYGLTSGQAGFISAFDFNGDGVIDIADFGQFSIRIFTVLP